jgi:hypothetical protein
MGMGNRDDLMCKGLLLSLILYTATIADTQQTSSHSAVLIEARIVDTGNRYRHRQLWVRLKSDGNLEWEESVAGKENTLRSRQVDQKEIEQLERILNEIDWKQLHGKMGPFNIYLDTASEIRISVRRGRHIFSLVNPWPGLPREPLPPFGGFWKFYSSEVYA